MLNITTGGHRRITYEILIKFSRTLKPRHAKRPFKFYKNRSNVIRRHAEEGNALQTQFNLMTITQNVRQKPILKFPCSKYNIVLIE